MCGINGIISKYAIGDLWDRLHVMNDAIIHRGPDAEGISVIDNCKGFGHRRLSIIDLNSSANQPMVSKSGRWILVFNGEIYNYQELKRNIFYEWSTNSDTEVILAALETKGVEWLLEKANGMFAFAAFNTEKGVTVIARDRFGVKPLYLYSNGNVVVFSSEIKGIIASGLVKAQVNNCAIDEYLANRYVREPYTFFNNIFQVRSSHYYVIDENAKIVIHRYWKLPEIFNCEKEYDEEQIAQEFEEELLRAVGVRLVADVPVGTYLSGGVDSSLLSVLASKKITDINAYSVGFPELNEFSYARIVSDNNRICYRETEIDMVEYFDVEKWTSLIKFKDAPLAVPNEIPLSILSKELKKNITVVLSGEGADELMGGYGKIFRLGYEYERYGSKGDFIDALLSKYEYVDRSIRNKYLSTEFSYRDYFREEIERKLSQYQPNELMFRFFHNYHIKGLLQRLDTTTMCYSVEGRTPFVDYKLVEFCYEKVPYDLKLKWNTNVTKAILNKLDMENISEILDTPKYLLKKVAMKYLPEAIVQRKKVGFPVPLNNRYAELVKISRSVLKNAYWLKKGVVDNLYNDLANYPNKGQLLWMFINVQLFMENCISSSHKKYSDC